MPERLNRADRSLCGVHSICPRSAGDGGSRRRLAARAAVPARSSVSSSWLLGWCHDRRRVLDRAEPMVSVGARKVDETCVRFAALPALIAQPSRTTARSKTSPRQSAPTALRIGGPADHLAASRATSATAAPSRRVQYRSQSSPGAASPSIGTAGQVRTVIDRFADAARRVRRSIRTGSTRTRALCRRISRRAVATVRHSRPPRRSGPRSTTPASTRPASGPQSSSRPLVRRSSVVDPSHHPGRFDLERRIAAQPAGGPLSAAQRDHGIVRSSSRLSGLTRPDTRSARRNSTWAVRHGPV